MGTVHDPRARLLGRGSRLGLGSYLIYRGYTSKRMVVIGRLLDTTCSHCLFPKFIPLLPSSCGFLTIVNPVTADKVTQPCFKFKLKIKIVTILLTSTANIFSYFLHKLKLITL